MRVEKEYKDRAKAEQLAIFSVMIDRRHISFKDGGGYMHESADCISLDRAARIMEILREED